MTMATGDTFSDYNLCMAKFVENTPNSSHSHLQTEGYIFSECDLHYCEDAEGSGQWFPQTYQMCLLPLDYIWGMVRELAILISQMF